MSIDRNAMAVAYLTEHFGPAWAEVLQIREVLRDGKQLPELEDFAVIEEVIKDVCPASKYQQATQKAGHIVSEWSQVLTSKNDLSSVLSSLGTSIKGSEDGRPRRDSGSDLMSHLTNLFADGRSPLAMMSSGYACAIVLAVGPDYAPAEAWNTVLEVIK